GVSRDKMPDLLPCGCAQYDLGAGRRKPGAGFAQTHANPVSNVRHEVREQMQFLPDARPACERRHQQIEFSIPVEIVSHNVTAVLLQGDAHEITNLEKRNAGSIQEEPILLESPI